MSKSIYNALKLLEVGSHSNVHYALHVQNKSKSQQNKLVVKDRSGSLADSSVSLPANLDYRIDNLAERKADQTTVYLAKSNPANISVMRAVTVSKLVYDFITTRLGGGFYPPYEAVNMQFTEGTAAFELTTEPESVADPDGNISFPLIYNIPEADAELAMASLDPNALIAHPRPVVTLRYDNDNWESIALSKCLFKTPDGLWWLAVSGVPQPAKTFNLQQYHSRILFNADGDLAETLREATLYSIAVTVLDAAFDPCKDATREVAVAVPPDTGPFDVVVNDTNYTFTNLEDFRVNAKTRLPADIIPKLLNKFIRPDISCAGATSSVYINGLSTDRYNVVIESVEYKDLTYTQLVALLEANNCIVKRAGIADKNQVEDNG